MPETTLRELAKATLPRSIRRLLRGCLHYGQRIGRWPIILWQVRGVTWRDQWILVRSALAAPLLSLENLLDWQDPVLLADAQVEALGVGRFLVRARCDDLWHVLPWREKAIFSELRSQLRPGDTFIDAGANIGIYSVLASKLVGRHGSVLAVEMMPDTADRLSQNLALNGISNATVCREALSNAIGELVTAEVIPGKYGQASIAIGKSVDTATRIEVTTTTLDELSMNAGGVRLIKMDLEGAEELALQGSKVLLGKTAALIFERWGTSLIENSSVEAFLRDAGFVLSAIDGNNWLAVNTNQQRQNQQATHL